MRLRLPWFRGPKVDVVDAEPAAAVELKPPGIDGDSFVYFGWKPSENAWTFCDNLFNSVSEATDDARDEGCTFVRVFRLPGDQPAATPVPEPVADPDSLTRQLQDSIAAIEGRKA